MFEKIDNSIKELKTLREMWKMFTNVLIHCRWIFPFTEADASHFFESKKTEPYQIDVYHSPQIGLDDQNILTTHDAMLSRQGSSTYQSYDAFVLFADEDCEFAGELIRRMEDYGLKVFFFLRIYLFNIFRMCNVNFL